MSEAQRIISRALSLMANGKARSWSHALALAADSVKPNHSTHERKPRPC